MQQKKTLSPSKRCLEISDSQTLAFEAKFREMKRNGMDVISLSAGEPDFSTPENIRSAAKKAIDQGFTKYTDTSGIPELKDAICSKLKADNKLDYGRENIIVSCGAKHSIYNASQAILNPGDEVLIPVPYWVSYSEQVKLAQAKPVFVNCKNFKVTAKDIRKNISPKTKMIILNSPSNPTGAMLSKDTLLEIAELAVQKNLIVLSDEIYEKISYEEEHSSIASLNEEIKALTITVNGISKSYAMTGWRIGYAAGPKDIIRAMDKLQGQMTSNPSSISQMAALEAITSNQSSVLEMRDEFRRRRDYVMSRIAKIKELKCQRPDGAFYVFADISSVDKNSSRFAQSLLDKTGVAVVPGIGFGMEGFIRISYATSKANLEAGMDRIERFIKNYKK